LSGSYLIPPTDSDKREYGAILPNGHFVRHLNFFFDTYLQDWVDQNRPVHVFHSTAYYKHPHERPMTNKLYRGSDLVFDIDGDITPQGKNGDRLQQVEAAKLHMTRLVEYCTEQLQADPDTFHIVFSGNRGYHLHVRDSRFRNWSKEQRQKLIHDLKDQGIIVDPKVTADTHRLIRLEGSTHGKTGLTVTAVSMNEMQGWGL